MAVAAALMLGMTGCKSVSKSDYDAAVNENAELRSQLQAMEAERAAKDAQLAETLRGTGEQNNGAYGSNVGNTGGYNTPNQDFTRGGDGNMVAEIAGDVLFASGQTTIKSDAKQKLDRIAKSLNGQYSGASIRIEGHTDTDPLVKNKAKWGSNQALSEARADAVKSYLATKGVSSSRIMTTGLGSTQPKSSKAASRRVEIVVLSN